MNLREQINTVNPSVAPALFRLLMRDDSTAYLRENNGIIGFEIVDNSPLIEGFALIGMRKRTILAYRSEDKVPKLVLFPSMDKLFNHSFGLLNLKAKKMFYRSDNFRGKELDEGIIADLVRDLTPPEKNIELPDNLTEQMIRIMISDHSDQEAEDRTPAKAMIDRFKPVGEVPTITQEESKTQPIVDEIKRNPYFNKPVSETPDKVVAGMTFNSEHEVMDFVVMTYGVDSSILKKLLNALLMKTQGMSKQDRTNQYKQLVAKLLKEKPEVIAK